MDVKTNQQLDFCVGCANGKQCKNSFQKGDPKKMFKILLKLMHIDVWLNENDLNEKNLLVLMIFTN